MKAQKLKIYGGNFDGTWQCRVAATSWKEAVGLLGNMAIGYAKRYGQAWEPRPEDQFLLDEPRVVWRSKDTVYPRKWERKPDRSSP